VARIGEGAERQESPISKEVVRKEADEKIGSCTKNTRIGLRGKRTAIREKETPPSGRTSFADACIGREGTLLESQNIELRVATGKRIYLGRGGGRTKECPDYDQGRILPTTFPSSIGRSRPKEILRTNLEQGANLFKKGRQWLCSSKSTND